MAKTPLPTDQAEEWRYSRIADLDLDRLQPALEPGAVDRAATEPFDRYPEAAARVVVVDRNEPDVLVAARIGSPVVIGVGSDESWVASDPVALRPFTDRMVVLDDGEIAEIRAGSFRTIDLDSGAEALARLEAIGIDLAKVAVLLEDQGVESFAQSFDDLVTTLDQSAANTPKP